MGNLYPLTPSLKPLLCKVIARGPTLGVGEIQKQNKQKKKTTSTASRLTLKASCASSSYSEVVVGGVWLIVIMDRGLVGLTVSNFFLLQDSVPPR